MHTTRFGLAATISTSYQLPYDAARYVDQVFPAGGAPPGATAKLGIGQSAAGIALADLKVVKKRPLFIHANGRSVPFTD